MTFSRRSGCDARGFTLIELMVVVAIIGILGAVAYPSYIQYIVKGKRSAAESAIMAAANKQMQYLLDARQYGTKTQLGVVDPDSYQITVTINNAATPPTFTITAAPQGAQATRDTRCGSVSINHAGTKSVSGTGSVTDCW